MDWCGSFPLLSIIYNEVLGALRGALDISLIGVGHVKVKVSPLQALKAHGDVDARVHIFTATALGRGRVASPTLGCLYPRESPQYSFYRRLSGPQDQSEHEGAKKNLHPSDLGFEPGPSSPQLSALLLEPPGVGHVQCENGIPTYLCMRMRDANVR